MKTFTKINESVRVVLLASSFLSVVMLFNYIAWF